MNKIHKALLFIIVLSFCLTGCSNNGQGNSTSNTTKSDKMNKASEKNTDNYKYFEIPDEILVYNKGDEKRITNKDSMFNQVLNLTNKRFTNGVDFYQLVVGMNDLKNFESSELVLEFLYADLKQTKYNDNVTKKYKRLIMPLTGRYSNCLFFDNGDEEGSSGPIATLSSSSTLIDMLK